MLFKRKDHYLAVISRKDRHCIKRTPVGYIFYLSVVVFPPPPPLPYFFLFPFPPAFFLRCFEINHLFFYLVNILPNFFVRFPFHPGTEMENETKFKYFLPDKDK